MRAARHPHRRRSHNETNRHAPAIAKEDPRGLAHVVRKEADASSRKRKRYGGDELVSLSQSQSPGAGGRRGGYGRGDTIHKVEQVHRIDDSENPEHAQYKIQGV
jgi:hypothetical protein